MYLPSSTTKTVAGWLDQSQHGHLPQLKDTLLLVTPEDVLEVDEMWSF